MPADSAAISCSSSLLAVALSTTSSTTEGPDEGPAAPDGGASSGAPPASSSSSRVCCRMETRVCSGMPGMSFSAMARSSVDLPEPLRPTSAYLWPALRWSLAPVRISSPSFLALALPLPDFWGADVTRMSRSSTSSCGTGQLLHPAERRGSVTSR